VPQPQNIRIDQRVTESDEFVFTLSTGPRAQPECLWPDDISRASIRLLCRRVGDQLTSPPPPAKPAAACCPRACHLRLLAEGARRARDPSPRRRRRRVRLRAGSGGPVRRADGAVSTAQTPCPSGARNRDGRSPAARRRSGSPHPADRLLASGTPSAPGWRSSSSVRVSWP
jgi:hypothetical protein